MSHSDVLDSARRAFDRKAWLDSFRLYEAADRESGLEPEDLERFATAAFLVGRDDESEAARARAHQLFLTRGNREAAAGSAGWLAFGLMSRGASAPASGWFARAERILDEADLDSVVRGYTLIPTAIRRIVQGDPAGGLHVFKQCAEIAHRFDDRQLASFSRHGQGRALIYLGRIREGIALLDEAMAAVIAGEVSPLLAGDIYCSVLEACQETFDLRRAHEWTTSLAQWCAAQPDLVRFRGECLIYRAELLRQRGKWNAAEQDAKDACEVLESRPAAGAAFYCLGDIHRLRGEFAQAEAAYARANEHGRKPQLGLSLLRLAQGRVELAVATIRGVLLDTRVRPTRARVLAPAIDILLAAGDLELARAAAAELSQIASAFDASFLSASAAHATGAVLLSEGDLAGASTALRRAWEIWRTLETPYEEAQSSLLLAAICERRGDDVGRRLELDNARRLFKELNAESSLARLAEPSPHGQHQPVASLSERELQVLRVLATGKSNRQIAAELFISEKTVARHVSNIFDKLGVSSRAAATACAYQHRLI